MRRFLVPLVWLLTLFVLATKLVEWTTDWWWFSSLGQGKTFGRLMAWRAASFVVGATLFALIFGRNLGLCLALLRSQATEWAFFDKPVNRFANAAFGPLRDGVAVMVAFFTLFAGAATANRFDLWVAFFGASPTGEIEKISGQDLSFFLFVLPALWWFWNFFGVAIGLSLFVCGLLYFWGDLIETGPQTLKVTRRASAHLAALGATLILWQGVRQGILAISAPIGPGWTTVGIFGPAEANFEVPVRYFLLFSSLPLAFFVFRVFTFWDDETNDFAPSRRRAPLAFSAAVWMACCLVLPALAAPFGRSLDRLRAASQNQTIEQRVAIARHLGNARRAWQIENLSRATLPLPTTQWRATNDATSQSVGMAQNAVGLWSPPALHLALERIEADPQLAFGDVTIFQRDGQLFYRAIAQNRAAQNAERAVIYEIPAASPSSKNARKLDVSALFLTETGASFARSAGRVPIASTNGAPNGGALGGGALPGSFDPNFAAENAVSFAPLAPRYRFSQSDAQGVPRDNVWRSFLLAWRFFDADLLGLGPPISWHVTPRERAQQLLPFLDWARSAPRPHTQTAGQTARVSWLLAGYSKSRTFPDSPAILGESSWQGANYVRHTVTLALDGATGAARVVPLQPDEPHLRVWLRAFPEAFAAPLDEAQTTTDFTENLRRSGPELLEAQAQILTRYHRATNEEDRFLNRAQLWRTWSANPLLAASGTAKNHSAPAWVWAFAPAQGTANATEGGPEITAFLLANPTKNGVRWQQFEPQSSLNLPETANFSTLNVRAAESLPFFAFDFEPPLGQNTPFSARGINFYRARLTKDSLQWDRQTLSAPRLPDSNDSRFEEAAKVWDDLKNARQRGAWAEVEAREKELDRLLKVQKTP